MSLGNVISFDAFVENRHKPEPQEKPHVRGYAPSWKSVCLDVLKVYQEVERVKRGRAKFGWTATRDAIMQDFDDVSGNRLAARDSALTHSHLVDWDRRGSIPDTAFRFVDRFVRLLAMTEDYAEVFKKAKAAHDKDSALAFSDVYQRRRVPQEMCDYLAEVSGDFLYSGAVNDSFYRHIVIRFDFLSRGVFKVTLAYCGFDIAKEVKGDMEEILFYEGFLFLIPTRSLGGNSNHMGAQSDSWICHAKLFRPQFKGSLVNGCADGRVEYGFLSAFPGQSFVTINLDFPSNILSPSGEFDCRDKRYIRPPSLEGNNQVKKLSLRNDQKYNDFFEKLFQKCYKGYLF